MTTTPPNSNSIEPHPRQLAAAHNREHRDTRLKYPEGNRDLEVMQGLIEISVDLSNWLRARDAPETVADFIKLMPDDGWRLKSDGQLATLTLNRSKFGIWQLLICADGQVIPEHIHFHSPEAGTTFAEASINAQGTREDSGTPSEPRYHPSDEERRHPVYIAERDSVHAVKGLAETKGGLVIFISFHTAPVLRVPRDEP